MVDIGVLLKQLRHEHGYTQAQVAQKMSVTNTTVASWENNFKFPSVERLIGLASLYHVPLNYLVGIQKERKVILTDLSQNQQDLLQRMVLEFDCQRRGATRLTECQKKLLADLIDEFIQD